MSPSRSSRRRERSQSPVTDSEEESYQRRNRARKEERRERPRREDDKPYRSSDRRERHRQEDREKRRSRSPRSSSKEAHRESGNRPRNDHPSRRKRSKERTKDEEYEQRVTRKLNGPLPSQEASFSTVKDPSGKALITAGDQPIPEKQKPNFAPSGLLAAASNSVTQVDGTTIALKYHEPPEARKPAAKDQWKLFVFKGGDIVETIELSTRSCWLIGREVAVVDMPAEHPSISKQHSVIQFRWIEKRNEYGDKMGKVRPYLIDLESANGTKLNKEPVPASRYLELRDKDMVEFGFSTREYVLMLPLKD